MSNPSPQLSTAEMAMQNMNKMILASSVMGLTQPASRWDDELQWVCDLHEATQKRVEEFVAVSKSQPGINGRCA